MNKPRRRRFFASRESRFQAQIFDAGPSDFDPEVSGATPSAPASEDETADSADEAPERQDLRESTDQGTEASGELPPAFQPLSTGRARQKNKRRSTWQLVLVSLGCLASGMLVGYFLPRPSAGASNVAVPDSTPKDVNPLTAADENDLDAAYLARGTRRFAEAEQLFRALGRRHADWRMMEIEAGRTMLYANNLKEAGAVLIAAADKEATAADANFLLGAVFSAEGLYPRSEASFARAVALNPTEPNYYYIWGECLRKEGKVLEATAKFRSALLRNQYETASGLYRLKMWLSEIESNREAIDGANAEIDVALSQPVPSMESLVAAAARNFKAGDTKAAVDDLLRARQRADATVFHIVLNDPFFAPLRSRPEMAGMF